MKNVMIDCMLHFIAPIVSNLQFLIERGGYTILFLAAVLEGLPIIGPLIPGHTAVVISGFLAKIGVFNLFIVLVLVIVGAMIGDIVGFIVGRKIGFVFLERFGKFFFIKNEHLEKAKQIVNDHTGKAIIIGRFNPITRSLMPFAVGASGVHIKSFWFYDSIGVFIWAIGSVALGYIFGASYGVASVFLGKFIAIAIVISILIVYGYKFVNRQFHVFVKYELIILVLNLSGLYVFFKTVQDTLSVRSFMTELDVWVNLFFSLHASAFWLTFMNIVSDVISPEVIIIVAIIGIVYFFYKKRWRYAVISIFSFAGLVLNYFIKDLVMRARPIDAFVLETGFSFPSGHAVTATIFFTLLVYFFARKIKSIIWREIFIVISVLLILLVAFSRIYLGVHWLSDVVAGIAFGLFWTTLMILLTRYIGMVAKKFKVFSNI